MSKFVEFEAQFGGKAVIDIDEVSGFEEGVYADCTVLYVTMRGSSNTYRILYSAKKFHDLIK